MGCFVQSVESGVCSGGGQHSMARHLTKQEHHMSGVVRARWQHVGAWQDLWEGQLTLTYLLPSCCVVVSVALEIHSAANYWTCAHKDQLSKSQRHLVSVTPALKAAGCCIDSLEQIRREY